MSVKLWAIISYFLYTSTFLNAILQIDFDVEISLQLGTKMHW